ncbi:uncharacterized protein B0I36DRAFT_132003 [Microdochium trichocladiopsis]|uniref:Uncharacterized protein n=1 Tax=Microdochium trichocladiopsis TaxID=1682393 RepID=A0A9P9BT18_9PEZI|nr:uncharacterized protein B0I36DRAFT_132003 [Microdochium trichocladiopsis]KAH7029381.1 hypothetical protein B0I36DRAFT_132003 [Microdochium trichocladiopsis]
MNCITNHGRRCSINTAGHNYHPPGPNSHDYTCTCCGCAVPNRPVCHGPHRSCGDMASCGCGGTRDMYRCGGRHDGNPCTSQWNNGGATCIVAVNASPPPRGENVQDHITERHQQVHHSYHHHGNNAIDVDAARYYNSAYHAQHLCHNCGCRYNVSASGIVPLLPPFLPPAPLEPRYFHSYATSLPPRLSSRHRTTTTTTTTTTDTEPVPVLPTTMTFPAPPNMQHTCCPACGVPNYHPGETGGGCVRGGGGGGGRACGFGGYRHIAVPRNTARIVEIEHTSPDA